MTSLDSFKCRKKLTVGGKTYYYFSLKAAEKHGLANVSALPLSMKILLENLAPLRGRPLGHQARHRGHRRLVER